MLVVAVVGCISAVRRGFEDVERTAIDASSAAPGVDQTLTITDPGGYTLGYVGPPLVFDDQDKSELVDRLQLSIVPADGGAPLELREYEGLNDVEAEGDQYVPLLTVRFADPGDYVLRSSVADLDPDRSALVVSESPWRRLRSGAERAGAILVVGIALAILVTVILARTRGRAKAVMRAQRPPPAPWPPAPGPWGGQPQWGGPPGWPPR